ncbi:MAG: CRISPR-associated endonuclease Cas1 [Bryobacterales bacterium]|nr:CRISPR-associated endonuclease Cas1 [Bryobacterales bacterium]
MAGPMPLALRTRWIFGGPRRTVLEEAFRKAGGVGQLALAEKPEKSQEGGTADMAFLYLSEQGSVLRKAGDRLLVEKEDEVLLDLPYHKLETVLLFGNIQVTTQAMAELLEKGIGLSLFSRQGLYRGQLTPPRGGNVEVRWKQFEACQDPQRSLAYAKQFVAAKLQNGLAVLDGYRKANEVNDAWTLRRNEVETAAGAVNAVTTIAELDGVEGGGARAYFEALMHFNKSGMEWPGRQKHPAKDPLNSLLSFTYMLLMHELTALLEAMGLDPYFGFLHQMDYGRPSLALDLIEPLRHPLADRLVLLCVNKGIVDDNDFQAAGERQAVYLAPKALKRYVAEYEHWMLARTPNGARRRDLLRAEVEGLVRSLRDRAEYQPYRMMEAPNTEEPECSTSSVTT